MSYIDFLENKKIIISMVMFLGLVFGSFATAVIYRLPRKIDFIKGRSRCTNCNHVLGVIDLFPVISWLYLRGRCRYCKVRFGISYIFIEILLSFVFVMIYLISGVTLLSLLYCFISLLLVIMIAIVVEKVVDTLKRS